MHHQDSTDAEVRGDQYSNTRVPGRPLLHAGEALVIEPGGPHHAVHSRTDSELQVPHHRVGGREINDRIA